MQLPEVNAEHQKQYDYRDGFKGVSGGHGQQTSTVYIENIFYKKTKKQII
jgi:hypothetical protein